MKKLKITFDTNGWVNNGIQVDVNGESLLLVGDKFMSSASYTLDILKGNTSAVDIDELTHQVLHHLSLSSDHIAAGNIRSLLTILL